MLILVGALVGVVLVLVLLAGLCNSLCCSRSRPPRQHIVQPLYVMAGSGIGAPGGLVAGGVGGIGGVAPSGPGGAYCPGAPSAHGLYAQCPKVQQAQV